MIVDLALETVDGFARERQSLAFLGQDHAEIEPVFGWWRPHQHLAMIGLSSFIDLGPAIEAIDERLLSAWIGGSVSPILGATW